MPLGVTPGDNVNTTLLFGTNAVYASTSNAVNIGGLADNTTELSAMGQLTGNVNTDIYKFNYESGNAFKLDFTNQTNTASLRVQVFDVSGNLLADNYGTPAQQSAYNQLNSDSGLSASTGQYYVQVSYAPGSPTTPQNYNFQLYSGTTYDNSIVTSAQIQSYDPNLFICAASSVSSSSSVLSYAQSATFSSTASQANALNIGNLVSNETQLYASSTITQGYSSDYYTFNFQQGSTIKLSPQNTTNSLLSIPLQAQLINSSGVVVADNYGTEAQKQAYEQLTSGEGFATANGQYTVRFAAPSGEPVTQPQTYNFQLFSGTSYNQSYQTTAKLPSTQGNSDAGGNLNIFQSSQAQSYTRSTYNSINETANSAINLGWLSENKSALALYSQLSEADSADYYSFTFQQGDALKFNFNNQTNTSDLRYQLYDISGSHVIADNYGTAEQKANFQSLTTSNGYNIENGTYIVKVSFAPDANKTKTQTYNFNIYSGDSYASLYKTTASAQTVENAILSGTYQGGGYTAASAAASYLSNSAAGTAADIIGTLSANA
jgi:hypothetical protein